MPQDKHSHHVYDGDRERVVYLRPEGGEATVDEEQAKKGKEVWRDEYVDHAGRPAVTKGHDTGTVEQFAGSDQTAYWKVEARKGQLLDKARGIDPTASDGKALWASLKEEWRATGSGPADKRQYAELRKIEDSYHAQRRADYEARVAEKERKHQEYLARQAERERKHQEYLARQAQRERERVEVESAKRRLIAEAHFIRPDDRSGRDQWRRIMDQWKSIRGGPKDMNDALWRELQQVRDQYFRGVNDNKRQRVTEMRQRASEIERRASELKSRANEMRWRPGYKGRDPFKAMSAQMDRERKIGDLNRKAWDLEAKARDIRSKADSLERSIRLF